MNIDSGRLSTLVGIRTTVQGDIPELSDDEGWQEREASRTHSVKFTDEPPEADKEVSSSQLARFPSFFTRLFLYLLRRLICMKRANSYTSLN